MRLQGQVRLPVGASPQASSVLILRIEDVSESDAPSRVLFRLEASAAHVGPFPFDFEFQAPQDASRLILTARIASDYVAPRAYTILQHLAEQTFDVELIPAA